MPDLSLFKPLCEELEITLNDLLSGEKVQEEKYQEKLEENFVNAIHYSTQKMNRYRSVLSLFFIIFGVFIVISAIMIFPSESSWGSIYSIFGTIIFLIGLFLFLNKIKLWKRLFILFAIFLGTMSTLLITDYINVKLHHEAPMFRMVTTTTGNVIYYDTLFYDVYRCHFDEDNEYWVIEKNSKKTIHELINYCQE